MYSNTRYVPCVVPILLLLQGMGITQCYVATNNSKVSNSVHDRCCGVVHIRHYENMCISCVVCAVFITNYVIILAVGD
jgi:hypothetical protein